MGGLNALSVPNGEFITYTRGCSSYELLLTNFIDGTEATWLDLYVETPDAVGVSLVHPRDGLAANGIDWDEREDDLGDEVHIIIGDEEKDGEAGPFGVISMSRDVAAQIADDIIYMLKVTEKGN
jgi:hypothetical protein